MTNVKDILIKQLAVDLKQPEDWVDKVVSFQFKEAQIATSLYSEIEISGFGKFLISQSKVKKRLAKHQEIKDAILNQLDGLDEKKKASQIKKLESLEESLAFYNRKLKQDVAV